MILDAETVHANEFLRVRNPVHANKLSDEQ